MTLQRLKTRRHSLEIHISGFLEMPIFFNLGQLGEISHRLTDEFLAQNAAIPWKAIYGMRNKIIHDYDGVNLKVVWETITEDLPELATQLKNFLKKN